MKKIMVVLACALLGTSGVTGLIGCERTNKIDDAEARKQYASLISGVETGQSLIVAQKLICEATTSLARQSAREKYGETVESFKGRRAVSCTFCANSDRT